MVLLTHVMGVHKENVLIFRGSRLFHVILGGCLVFAENLGGGQDFVAEGREIEGTPDPLSGFLAASLSYKYSLEGHKLFLECSFYLKVYNCLPCKSYDWKRKTSWESNS